MPSVACTISGAAQFGSTSLNISRIGAGAGHPRRGDIILGDFGDHRGARDAHIMRQQHEGDREHRIHQAGAEDRDDHDGEQQARQRQDDVHRAA